LRVVAAIAPPAAAFSSASSVTWIVPRIERRVVEDK
jgi:hypothetical protein